MRAIVIGRNYTSRLGMIRAAGQAGAEVFAVVTTRGQKNKLKAKLKAPDINSRYVNKVFYSEEPDREDLIHVLMTMCKCDSGKAIIIPVDDYAASTVDQYADRLKDSFAFPNIDYKQGAITQVMEKARQKEMARVAGFPVANGWRIEPKQGTYQLPSDIKYPCFPKPEVSYRGTKRIMKRCDNEDELTQALDEFFLKFDCPVLIEEYIQIEKEYGVLGFCDHEIVYTPYLIWKKGTGSGGHRGVTMNGQICPIPENLAKKINIMMSSLSFTGVFDLDLYESKGEMYFNELNMRFGAAGYAVTAMGENLPDILLETLSGKQSHSQLYNTIQNKKKDIQSNQKHVEFVSEKVVFDDYYNGYMDRKTYKQLTDPKAPVIKFIRQKNDMKPYWVFKGMSVLYMLMSTLKKRNKR